MLPGKLKKDQRRPVKVVAVGVEALILFRGDVSREVVEPSPPSSARLHGVSPLRRHCLFRHLSELQVVESAGVDGETIGPGSPKLPSSGIRALCRH